MRVLSCDYIQSVVENEDNTPKLKLPKTNGRRIPKTEKRSQAERIYEKFGGVKNLTAAINALGPEYSRTIHAVYKWSYPREKGGSGGVIPSHAIGTVQKAAIMMGIHLTVEDLYPGVL